ncbi:alpha-mannosidase [bacterium]|nr:alpha-mannosidase [bacterium]
MDGKTGRIARLHDVKHKRDVLSAPGGVLQLWHEQHYRWDAWNIATLGDSWTVDSATRIEPLESGPVRTVVRVHRGFNRAGDTAPTSTFATDYILYHDLPRLDVGMEIDWQEEHLLLKCAFPLAVDAATYTCEMPFGYTLRPNKPETAEEKAQFEVPMQRWADLSQSDYGVSFFTQNKYGCDCRFNTFRLTLLKSSTYPDPRQDRGRHRFRFALYPHAGDWREAETMQRAYEYNEPLRWRRAGVQPGPLGRRHSFIAGAPGGVMLETVKRGEDDPETILRLYEVFGRESAAEYRFDRPLLAARETDLLEWDRLWARRGVDVEGDLCGSSCARLKSRR